MQIGADEGKNVFPLPYSVFCPFRASCPFRRGLAFRRRLSALLVALFACAPAYSEFSHIPRNNIVPSHFCTVPYDFIATNIHGLANTVSQGTPTHQLQDPIRNGISARAKYFIGSFCHIIVEKAVSTVEEYTSYIRAAHSTSCMAARVLARNIISLPLHQAMNRTYTVSSRCLAYDEDGKKYGQVAVRWWHEARTSPANSSHSQFEGFQLNVVRHSYIVVHMDMAIHIECSYIFWNISIKRIWF